MVSIHTPTAGSDKSNAGHPGDGQGVSIHAPYAGSDFLTVEQSTLYKLFQSTPPMQGATAPCALKLFATMFQSTPPMQGATAISAKNSSSFSAEIDKLSFQILKFPLFSSPLRLQNTPFVHI